MDHGDFQGSLYLTLTIHLRVECNRRFAEGFLFSCSPQCLGFVDSMGTAGHLLYPWILLGSTVHVWRGEESVLSAMPAPLQLPSFWSFSKGHAEFPGTLGGTHQPSSLSNQRSLLPASSCSKPIRAAVCDILRAELRATGKGKDSWGARAERAGWGAGTQGLTGAWVIPNRVLLASPGLNFQVSFTSSPSPDLTPS